MPVSLMGVFYLNGLLNRVPRRDAVLKLAKERIPVENPERGVLIALLLELLIERCFTKAPDDATIQRFLDHMFAGMRDSSRPDTELSIDLVRLALSPDGIPELSSPLDGKVITTRVALSAAITLRYGLGEAELGDIIARAEARATSLGIDLVPA